MLEIFFLYYADITKMIQRHGILSVAVRLLRHCTSAHLCYIEFTHCDLSVRWAAGHIIITNHNL